MTLCIVRSGDYSILRSCNHCIVRGGGGGSDQVDDINHFWLYWPK